jgi:Protein of unknown function (DUF3106)
MKKILQAGGWLLALVLCAGLAQSAEAQRNRNRPPDAQTKQERRQERQQARQHADRPPRAKQDRQENPNRPPNAGTLNGDASRNSFRDRKPYSQLTPDQQERVRERARQWQGMSQQQRQQLRDRARVWEQMTPQQRDHIRNDVLPKWRQLPTDRKQAIQERLSRLKNMPESARNQRLSDPQFTKGMSPDDVATLRDLSHLHVGGTPDGPGSDQ